MTHQEALENGQVRPYIALSTCKGSFGFGLCHTESALAEHDRAETLVCSWQHPSDIKKTRARVPYVVDGLPQRYTCFPGANTTIAATTFQTPTMSTASVPSIATPGQPLALADSYLLGAGTHLHASHIVSTIAGAVSVLPTTPKPTLTVMRTPLTTTNSASTATTSVLPAVSSVVLARVTRINPRQATVTIFCVGDVPLVDEFQGIIRVQDVRATEKDKVKIFESFRPGDIVRALVISLGDQSNYYLSTAQNSLGVVMAYSGGQIIAESMRGGEGGASG